MASETTNEIAPTPCATIPSKHELDVAAQRAAAAIAQRLRNDASGLSEDRIDRRDQAIRWIEHGKRPWPYSNSVQHLWQCFELQQSEWTSLTYHFADESLRLADDFFDHVVLLIRPYWSRASQAELSSHEAARSPAIGIATQAISSARAFAAAIDALPVGKDIRSRLQALLGEHIGVLEQLSTGLRL